MSVPGSVAFFLDKPAGEPLVPDILGGEWGHIHPHYDGSLHMQVPIATASKLIDAGWAEHHTLVGKGILPPIIIMVYGPRDEAELEVVKFAVGQAYVAAGGLLA